MHARPPWMLFVDDNLRLSLDVREPAFVQDPYAAYRPLHAAGGRAFWEQFGFWCTARFAEVDAILRDRRFAREPPAEARGGDRSHLVWFDRVERRSLLNLEPPEAIGQMLISLAVFFVYTTVICSIVGLVLGLAFVALTRTRMQSGRSIGAVHGALLGLASVAVGTALFSFSGPTSSILVVLLLGAMCGASAGAIVGYKATESTST